MLVARLYTSPYKCCRLIKYFFMVKRENFKKINSCKGEEIELLRVGSRKDHWCNPAVSCDPLVGDLEMSFCKFLGKSSNKFYLIVERTLRCVLSETQIRLRPSIFSSRERDQVLNECFLHATDAEQLRLLKVSMTNKEGGGTETLAVSFALAYT